MLRITAYADRLEQDLDTLRLAREHQGATIAIGSARSTGRVDSSSAVHRPAAPGGKPSPVEFKGLAASPDLEEGFPERPSTTCSRLHDASRHFVRPTYWCWAPDLRWWLRRTSPSRTAAVQAYCEQASRKSDLDRPTLAKEDRRVQPFRCPVNPANLGRLPVWIADTCWPAMQPRDHGPPPPPVPAHDTRDLSLRQVRSAIVRWSDPGDDASVNRDDFLRKAVFAGDALRSTRARF